MSSEAPAAGRGGEATRSCSGNGAGMRLADGEGFARLAAEHRRGLEVFLLRRLDNREDAQDAAALTLAKAWQARGTFRHEASIKTWLYAIAARVALDILRQRRTQPAEIGGEAGFLALASEPAAPENDPIEWLLRKEERGETCRRVRQAIARLSREQRQLVRLRYLEGCGHAELARRLGIPRAEVDRRLRRVCVALRRSRDLHRFFTRSSSTGMTEGGSRE